jgi:hypothetical protein
MTADVALQALLMVPVLLFNSWIAVKLYVRNNRRREMKFLKRVQVAYPDSKITFTSVETSDAKALENIQSQFEEEQWPTTMKY